MNPRSTISIIVRVFIPFMVTYMLPELYHNISAIAGSVIRDELRPSIEHLGLMASLFLVAIAGTQVFTGIWLDRFGAHRTVVCLLLVGALGAALFSLGGDWLLIGRFLIGVGMAQCWRRRSWSKASGGRPNGWRWPTARLSAVPVWARYSQPCRRNLWRPDEQGIHPEVVHQTAFGAIIAC